MSGAGFLRQESAWPSTLIPIRVGASRQLPRIDPSGKRKAEPSRSAQLRRNIKGEEGDVKPKCGPRFHIAEYQGRYPSALLMASA
jgi:hypothetical protein